MVKGGRFVYPCSFHSVGLKAPKRRIGIFNAMLALTVGLLIYPVP